MIYHLCARLCAPVLVLLAMTLPAQTQNITYHSIVLGDTHGNNPFGATLAHDQSVIRASLGINRRQPTYMYLSSVQDNFHLTQYETITVGGMELYILPVLGYKMSNQSPNSKTTYYVYQCPSGDMLLAGYAVNIIGKLIKIEINPTGGFFDNIAPVTGGFAELDSAFEAKLRADSESWRIPDACGGDDTEIVDATIE